MKSNYKLKDPHAFSLIEISVVLVIVGLLFSGIFGLSFMKKKSELLAIQSMAKELNKAYTEFVKIYDQKPGDIFNAQAKISIETENGNGNGVIEYDAIRDVDERFLSLQHLSLAGLIKRANYSGSHILAEDQIQIYGLKSGNFKDSGLYLDHDINGLTILVFATVKDLDEDGRIEGGEARLAALSPFDASEIDKKFDDGLPESGEIRAIKGSGSTFECMAEEDGQMKYLTHEDSACVIQFYLEYDNKSLGE